MNEVGSIRPAGPAIERSGDLLALLNESLPNDEIHRLPRVIEGPLFSHGRLFCRYYRPGPSAHPVPL